MTLIQGPRGDTRILLEDHALVATALARCEAFGYSMEIRNKLSLNAAGEVVFG